MRLVGLLFVIFSQLVNICWAQENIPQWPEIKKLIDEQKLKEAKEKVETLLLNPASQHNEILLTDLLIQRMQLGIALGGFETSLNELHSSKWPQKESLSVFKIKLAYIIALQQYSDNYQWEIRQRDKTVSDAFDLKIMTMEDLNQEILKNYLDLWKSRNQFENTNIKSLSQLIQLNNYPPGIRSKFIDVLTYSYITYLANTSYWSAKISAQTQKLPFQELVQVNQNLKAIDLSDVNLHPLKKIQILLSELYKYHQQNKNFEAALESRLALYRHILDSMQKTDEKLKLIENFKKELVSYRSYPWYTMGLFEVAKQLQLLKHNKDAVETAKLALNIYPTSIGTKNCNALIQQLQNPDFNLETMRIDGTNKESLLLTYRNISKVYFRSYKFDLLNYDLKTKDFNLWPNERELKDLLKQKPFFEWNATLDEPKDFQEHRKLVTINDHNNGFYYIVASLSKEFSETKNILHASTILVSPMVLGVKLDYQQKKLNVQVQEGQTGKPVSNVKVSLYARNYNEGARFVKEKQTDNNGFVDLSFDFMDKVKNLFYSNRSYFLIAKKNQDYVISNQSIYFSRPNNVDETNSSIIYSDRSIYRPEQKILWKVLAYTGRIKENDYHLVPQKALKVELRDFNNKVVSSTDVKTDSYGSANGEFVIPSGRMLGLWKITTSNGGNLNLRVEEYKRPTFELKWLNEKQVLSLNQSSELNGSAEYFFGGPVNKGKIEYEIFRQPQLPWWCFWNRFYWSDWINESSIVQGEVPLTKEGTFVIKWKPEGETKLILFGDELSYNFRVKLKLTDEGGETRTLDGFFNVAKSELRTQLSSQKQFGLINEEFPIEWNITNAVGDAVKAKATWSLYQLQQPDKSQLPSEISVPSWFWQFNINEQKTLTNDDQRNSRWNNTFNPQLIVRQWKESQLLSTGSVESTGNKNSPIAIKQPKPGAYRLVLEVTDRNGQKHQTKMDLWILDADFQPQLAAYLVWQKDSFKVGEKAKLFYSVGWVDQYFDLELYQDGNLLKSLKNLKGNSSKLLEIPIVEKHRGGFTAVLKTVRDYQPLQLSASLYVPWDNKEIQIKKLTLRDKINPGSKEKWSILVEGPNKENTELATYQVLAYMYDHSLDAIYPHRPFSPLSLLSTRTNYLMTQYDLGASQGIYLSYFGFPYGSFANFQQDVFNLISSYGIGGPGQSGFGGNFLMSNMEYKGDGIHSKKSKSEESKIGLKVGEDVDGMMPMSLEENVQSDPDSLKDKDLLPKARSETQTSLPRTNFAETAFWYPNLRANSEGKVQWEFTVPDSLTSWNLWVHAFSNDLKYGSLSMFSQSSKDLMIRSYLPRFVREGDQVSLQFQVYNLTEKSINGVIDFEILDQKTSKDLTGQFGLAKKDIKNIAVSLKAKESKTQNLKIKIPTGIGVVSIKATIKSDNLADSELNVLPILPGRFHLTQSKTAILRNKTPVEVQFSEWANNNDPSRVNDKAIITVDAQLFYSVLNSIPYLISYPYECVEQILNRFLSAGIMNRLSQDFPSIKKAMNQMAQRKTETSTWNAKDPNRLILIEESPWVYQSEGQAQDDLINTLKPEVTKKLEVESIKKLNEAQTALGGFPWFPGGAPSPYMTLYILSGFAKAHEFGIEIPKEMIQKAWGYLHRHYVDEIVKDMRKSKCCYEIVTYMNFVLSSYPDSTWQLNLFTELERNEMLNYSFSEWKNHSPLLKGYLSLTLWRQNRKADAKLVWDSVMDSAIVSDTEGTHWATEDRSWLWYNDRIESHSFALNVGSELGVSEKSLDGLVQWIFLNKKLNHWGSTKSTAEVVYSLARYLQKTSRLEQKDKVQIDAGAISKKFEFNPEKYTGSNNQIVIPGEKINSDFNNSNLSKIKFSPNVSSFAFATTTWHYSTEIVPQKSSSSDFINIHKKYFLRTQKSSEALLVPILNNTALKVGDEVEVQISILLKHPMEYVHLRDPRPSGFEPQNQLSTYRWDKGISWFEEIRDSATNFFFEHLPQGEYTFRYRIRITQAGEFKAFPAQIQSQYAPEFSAFSEGALLKVSL